MIIITHHLNFMLCILNSINQIAIQTVVLLQLYLSWGVLFRLFVLLIHPVVKFVLLLLQFLVTT
jgi:hypothetical protein